jgi:hypothetical protein
MPIRYHKISPLALTLLVFALVLIFSALLCAQDTGCNYDRTKPSLENARLNFKSLNYPCAEEELLDRLRVSSLSLQEKADTYVLLAAVYYAMLADDTNQRRDKVIEQFSAAFEQYRDWKGTLDIASSEFAELMEEAKQRVDSGVDSGEDVTQQPISIPAKIKDCPSSTMAWVSTGVFVAAAGFFMVSSSGVNSKWDDYESDPAHPTGLYDDYKSANSTRNIAGVATIATGLVTGYLWMKYRSSKSDCDGTHADAGLDVAPTSRGILLTYRF